MVHRKSASNGQPLGLSFSGSVWAYLGWTILTVLSIFTIIGWAWVYTAWLRWFCRNVQGTRREVLFIGSGLEFLWRAIVLAWLRCSSSRFHGCIDGYHSGWRRRPFWPSEARTRTGKP